ncbi:MAG: aminotransferase class I/II-fold pyridoxal phosphate-dependent enzyme [Phycisphaeraceae bacterium]|nr:MAG: aminotransferase class I/II-fold pyridoxal phosphate-dependent enzyme [Phycisphaeraceae bacterium]
MTHPPRVSRALAPLGTTIFTEMTALAARHGAVNLAQGFPDFDGPELAKDAAIGAIRAGHSQYARMAGIPLLCAAVARAWSARAGLPVDPDSEVTVTSGCTEAIAASVLGLLDPGDGLVMFEPFYDSYRAVAAMGGAMVRAVSLRPEPPATPPGPRGFAFDEGELRRAIRGSRMILLNTPHNPTGKVFSREELGLIASLCREHDVIAVVDEVYEHLTYDPARPHVSLATLPGMWERTLTLGSLGKSYNLTGWKIGWAIGPASLTAGVRSAHQYLTFATATPLQHGAAAVIEHGVETIARTRDLFRANRDRLSEALASLGFGVFRSDGAYFVMADHTGVSGRLGLPPGDRAMAAWLIEHAKVAVIPPGAFYRDPGDGSALVRLAYCKRTETIDEAIRRLRAALAG